MSIEAMSWALATPCAGNAKVVLLGLANHAHADGSNAFPSVRTLAEYARVDARTVRRKLRELADAGLIEQDGTGRNGVVCYRLLMGVTDCPPPDTGVRGGMTAVSAEPSDEPSTSSPDGEDDAREPIAFTDWLQHHARVSGHSVPGVGTQRRHRLMLAFRAIEADGFNPDDFIAASRAVTTDWHKEHGHDSFETVLRKTEFGAKVARGRAEGAKDAARAPIREKYDGMDGAPAPQDGGVFD